MNDLEQLAKELRNSPKATELAQIAASRDAKKLERMIDGAALEQAMKNGDTAALRKTISSLLATGEGKRLAQDLQKLMKP